ncbi:MAG TPA: NAD(P)H-dependent oxidoreductase [Caldimonas sp.]|nr:NAD(P)H-dependent oxidoreductase [Caldimonas sp.]HEV7577851.1 NAD(P)H-dependent oxidoreductase [Caldimonas sp.]
MTEVRTGQAPDPLDRDEFGRRFRRNFVDPAFRAEDDAIGRVEQIAWQAYSEGRKAPITKKAGPGYADPDYDLSLDWIEARTAVDAAQKRWADPAGPTRALVVCGSPRNDGTCPGEISKTFRLANIVKDVLAAARIDVDFLDLSLQASEYGRKIHPCKGCVSTAMPLCHWPCSCYPNHALAQTNDWMNELYPRLVAAHAIVFVTPTHWYSTSSALKLMIDRLVCADGGNPDPSSTHGKKPEEAKALELKGWGYPKHLDRRVYGLVVHGDVAGIEGSRRALSDWLDWMGLIDAGVQSRLDRFIGYYEPYATSHEALDRDEAVQEETRNVARAVVQVTAALRAGALDDAIASLPSPRPK